MYVQYISFRRYSCWIVVQWLHFIYWFFMENSQTRCLHSSEIFASSVPNYGAWMFKIQDTISNQEHLDKWPSMYIWKLYQKGSGNAISKGKFIIIVSYSVFQHSTCLVCEHTRYTMGHTSIPGEVERALNVGAIMTVSANHNQHEIT